MDRNRKILISIFALLLLSLMMAVIDISLRMQDDSDKGQRGKEARTGPGIGIVRVEGPIGIRARTGPLDLSAGSEGIIRRLDDLSRNGSIKAVVLRINSPGGTVAAVQEIYSKLWKLRKRNIPLVASMGDIATSGGYYIASPCNFIMANNGTITGSIGVIALSPNMKGLFEKLGIKMNVIKSGNYKDIFSSHRDITKEETQLLQEMIDTSYRRFLKDVALGRNQNQSEIEPYADGRVMNGETALKYKLIDAVGTFEDAVDKARELAKLDENSPVYDEIMTPFQQIMMSLDGMFRLGGVVTESMNRNTLHLLEYRDMP